MQEKTADKIRGYIFTSFDIDVHIILFFHKTDRKFNIYNFRNLYP